MNATLFFAIIGALFFGHTLAANFQIVGMRDAVLFATVGFSFFGHGLAANLIRFTNKCPYDVWYWTVGPVSKTNLYLGEDWQRNLIPRNGGSAVHGLVNTEVLGGGMSLKIRDLPDYRVAPAGIVQLEYHLEPSRNHLWYDLSVINCDRQAGTESPSFCPLIGGGINLYVNEADGQHCPPAWCSRDQCHNTYEEHGSWYGEPSFKCTLGADLFIDFCANGVGPHTFENNPPTWSPEVPAIPASDQLPQGPLVASPNGLCGYQESGEYLGYTCAGTHWGQCCSQWGYCGTGSEYCNDNAQRDFGGSEDPEPASPAVPLMSLEAASQPTRTTTGSEGTSYAQSSWWTVETDSLSLPEHQGGIPHEPHAVQTVTAVKTKTETVTEHVPQTVYVPTTVWRAARAVSPRPTTYLLPPRATRGVHKARSFAEFTAH